MLAIPAKGSSSRWRAWTAADYPDPPHGSLDVENDNVNIRFYQTERTRIRCGFLGITMISAANDNVTIMPKAPAPHADRADRIEWLRLSSCYLPLANPISDA